MYVQHARALHTSHRIQHHLFLCCRSGGILIGYVQYIQSPPSLEGEIRAWPYRFIHKVDPINGRSHSSVTMLVNCYRHHVDIISGPQSCWVWHYYCLHWRVPVLSSWTTAIKINNNGNDNSGVLSEFHANSWKNSYDSGCKWNSQIYVWWAIVD